MKKVRSILFAISIISFFAILGIHQDQSVSAKTKYIESFPKQMRGTWYAYSPDMALTKFTIKKNSFKEVMFANKKNKNDYTYILKKPLTHNQYNKLVNIVNRLESRKKVSKKDKKSFINNRDKYLIANYSKSRKHTWLYITSRFYAGGAYNDNGYFKVQKINKFFVLSYAKSYQSVTNYVKSKSLAKKEAKHNKNIDELYF